MHSLVLILSLALLPWSVGCEQARASLPGQQRQGATAEFEGGLKQAPPAILLGPTAVWAKGSQIFHPLSRPMASSNFSLVRFSTEMSEESGDCKMRPAVRFSGDGVTWGGDKEVDSTWILQDGVTYGEAYVNLLSLALTPPKTYIQFGVQVNNQTGSDLTICNATLRLEAERK